MEPTKECLNNGFSVATSHYRVTMVYNEAMSTFSAAVWLFDEELGDFAEPYVWGSIESEYPTLHPLPWLVCKYIGEYEWLTEDLLNCLEEVSPDIAPFIPGGHSALMDYLARSIYDYRIEISSKARRRFFEREVEEEEEEDD